MVSFVKRVFSVVINLSETGLGISQKLRRINSIKA